MKAHIQITITLMLTFTFFSSPRGDDSFPPEDLQRVQKFFEASMSSRYMESNCAPTTYREWEKFPYTAL